MTLEALEWGASCSGVTSSQRLNGIRLRLDPTQYYRDKLGYIINSPRTMPQAVGKPKTPIKIYDPQQLIEGKIEKITTEEYAQQVEADRLEKALQTEQ